MEEEKGKSNLEDPWRVEMNCCGFETYDPLPTEGSPEVQRAAKGKHLQRRCGQWLSTISLMLALLLPLVLASFFNSLFKRQAAIIKQLEKEVSESSDAQRRVDNLIKRLKVQQRELGASVTELEKIVLPSSSPATTKPSYHPSFTFSTSSLTLSPALDPTKQTDDRFDNTLNWYREECYSFYDDKTREQPQRRIQPQMKALEDFCPGGRGKATVQAHDRQEAMLIPELNAVYIEIRKSDSTTIRNIFGNVWSIYFTLPESKDRDPVECEFFGRRRSSLCLTAEQIQNLVIFSFVRDPVERFYSSVKQAHINWNRETFSCSDIDDWLHKMDGQNKQCHHDEHLETQTFSLSTPIHPDSLPEDLKDRQKYMVPMDFIGKVENLREDIHRLLKLVERRNNKKITDKEYAKVELWLSKHSNPGGKLKEQVMACRNATIDDWVKNVYSQDRACFGY